MPYILMSLILSVALLPYQASARSLLQLNHQIPADVVPSQVAPDHPDWLQRHQHQVNRHAWQTFIALMWPALTDRGRPDIGALFGKPTHRVWETWKEQIEVYPVDGSAPLPWRVPETIPATCQTQPGQPLRHLHRNEKVDDVLDAINQAAKADATLPGTLTDQYGKVVRYEIRMNRTVFDYIVQNQLYNGNQQAEVEQIQFPDGAMLIKAAWRELTTATSAQDRQRFMTRKACICDGDACHIADVALVGFHIMHKTASAPQWIWSTFEHKANVRRSHGLPASFRRPRCQGEYCAPNSQTPTGTPNQVTQVLPMSRSLRNLNHRVHRWLKKADSVLHNYRLMSAQWPLPQSDAEKPTVFHAQPRFAANTTMETFTQDTSSCMGCHAMARSMKPDQFVSSDFTFTLNNAHPTPDSAICASYSYSNSIGCSEQTILFNPAALSSYPAAQAEQITRGHQLLSHTYEQLPEHVGNKLHCRSCHLHAGGVPEASWWVNMRQAYVSQDAAVQAASPAAALQGRINQCFERSLHGKALCTPASAQDGTIDAGNCDTNPDMSAMIAYMDWLTDTYHQQHPCPEPGQCPPTPRGFPALTQDNVIGRVSVGQAIFEQKCAFCHNSEGQGRYASGTYFRPALWGDHSYPAIAGMGKPEKLARFLRWNMPYGSGGLLTDQEAQDLACFIDAQPRAGQATRSDSNSSQCVPTVLDQ